MEEHKNCCYEAGCFVTTHNDTIIVGSDSYRGLYYSEDNGHTWYSLYKSDYIIRDI